MKAVKLEVVLRHALLPAALGWLLGVSGCAGAGVATNTSGTPGGGTGPTVTPATAMVSFCSAAQTNCQSQSANFSLKTSNIPTLNIKVDWANVAPGTHSQEMRLMLPNGYLYERLQSTFFVPRGGDGSASVNRNIPIVGTYIAQRQMTGGWKIRVSLDGKAVTTGDLRLDP
jgi:hypothetical protein